MNTMSPIENNRKNKLVIFDFDGVLLETSHISHGIIKKTNPHISFEDFQKMSHGNFHDSYQSGNPIVQYTPDPTYTEQYRDQILECSMSGDIETAVKDLSEEYTLCIVSSAFESSIRDFLDRDNLTRHFSDILGADTHTSKVVKLQSLLDKYEIDPQDSIFITDTLGDILESNTVQIRSIGVLWGLHDRETLERGNPTIIIDAQAVLKNTIENILNS